MINTGNKKLNNKKKTHSYNVAYQMLEWKKTALTPKDTKETKNAAPIVSILETDLGRQISTPNSKYNPGKTSATKEYVQPNQNVTATKTAKYNVLVLSTAENAKQFKIMESVFGKNVELEI